MFPPGTAGALKQEQLIFVKQVEARIADEIGPAPPLGQLLFLGYMKIP
jgi:hypothetical protein